MTFNQFDWAENFLKNLGFGIKFNADGYQIFVGKSLIVSGADIVQCRTENDVKKMIREKLIQSRAEFLKLVDNLIETL